MKNAEGNNLVSGFRGAAKGHAAAIQKKVAAFESQFSDLFTAVPVTKCRKDKSYFLPRTGVVKCTDITVIEITGMPPTSTTKLEQVFVKNPARQFFTHKQLLTANLRELIGEDTFKTIEKILEKGETLVTLQGSNPMQKNLLMETLSRSSNPVVLAHVAARVFGKSQESSKTGLSYVDDGNRALETLAREYATVKNTPYDVALKTLSKLAGKLALDSLSGYPGTSPYDNRSPG